MKSALVIPAKNEEEGLSRLLPKVPKGVFSEILIVDGLSTDRTGDVARKFGAKVVPEPRRGYGRAYKTGFENVSPDVEAIVCLDADATYPVSESKRVLGMLSDHDFVSCSRKLNDRNMGLKHRFGNRVLSVSCSALFGFSLRDSQSGMWAFRKELLGKMNLRSDGMGFSEEIKVEAHKHGKFAETDVDYYERVGEVKLNSFRDGFSNLWFLLSKRILG